MSDAVDIIEPGASSDAANAARPVLQLEYKPGEPTKASAAAEAAPSPKPEPRVPPRPRVAKPSAWRSAQRWIDRNGMVTAGVLLALGVGWLGGANTFARPPAPDVAAAPWTVLPWKADVILGSRSNSTDLRRLADELKTLRSKVASLEATANRTASGDDLRALRKTVDAMREGADSSRTERLKAISDLAGRLDKLDAGPRLDKLSERVDTIERQTAAMPTGSIPGVPAPSSPATPAGVAARATPPDAHPAAAPVPTPPVRDTHVDLDRDKIPNSGWILREVRRGAALVEGRDGLREIAPGDTLAGAGRVRAIEKRAQGWVVVTSNGVIDAEPY